MLQNRSPVLRPPTCAAQSALRGLRVIQQRRGMPTPPDNREIVQEVVEKIIATLPKKLSLSRAALAIGIPMETMEYAFGSLGVKPRRYIRMERLRRLHEDISARRFDSLELAFRHWGFPARSPSVRQEYMRLFGRAAVHGDLC